LGQDSQQHYNQQMILSAENELNWVAVFANKERSRCCTVADHECMVSNFALKDAQHRPMACATAWPSAALSCLLKHNPAEWSISWNHNP
jgi:hypothetical protein